MAKIVMGALPEPLEVQLVHGDGAPLVATLVDESGAELDWPSAPTLEFSGAARTVVASHPATIAGPTATWSLSRAQVDAIWDATKALSQSTLVRAVLPDGDDGSVEYAGAVVWSDGWTAGKRTQVVSFTLPGGLTGPAGVGVPAGGTTGQALLKNSADDYDTEWGDVTGGGPGAVTSVAGRTGTVVLTSSDVGLGNVNNTSDANKPVSTAQAAADAAVQAAAATDATTKANAAQAAAIAASQPVDSDLTAIAALTTTAYGRAFLGLANQAALVALLPSYQPLDSDLTAIAALSTTTYGRGLLALADAAALKTSLALVKGDVGLGSVDNTADASKPVSTAQAAADTAVQAFAIQRANHTGTQAQSTVTNLVSDLAAKAPTASPTFTGTVSGVTKAHVGLGNVDNTADSAKPVSTAQQAALDGKAPVRATINAQTGTTYTIVLSDENKLVTLTNAGAITVTLPSDATVAIPVGGRIDFQVRGAGMATFVAGSGATVDGTPSLVTYDQFSTVSAQKVAANTWTMYGRLA